MNSNPHMAWLREQVAEAADRERDDYGGERYSKGKEKRANFAVVERYVHAHAPILRF